MEQEQNKEAVRMASNEMEVLESAAKAGNGEGSESGFALSRRQLMSALTVAGAAAGIALVSGPSAAAQQPVPHGYSQIDVMNFLLNVKYLTATLYSYVTQGADLPASSFTTVGTGGVFNAPAKITFTGTNAAQITDLFLELYYDELNHIIDLRNLLGTAVVGRQTISLAGTGAATNTKTSYTPSEVIALARMLEDVSVTAFAGAAIYLSGSNLDYATRVLAADGFHAGALRLVSIQTGAQYQSPAYSFGSVTSGGETAINFTGVTIATPSPSNQIYSILGTIPPAVGNLLTGVGIPQGAGAAVTAVTSKASIAPTGILAKSSTTVTNVSSLTGVAKYQPVTGTNIAAGTYVADFDPTDKTITLSTAASGSSTVAPTGFVTSGNNVVTGVSSFTGVVVGQSISGTNIPSTPITTITAIDSKAATITMSAPASATTTVKPTGVVTAGSAQVASLSSTSGLIAGQPISGAGIPTGTFIGSVSGNTLTLSDSTGQNPVLATADSPVTTTYTFSGVVVSGSNVITPSGTFSGIVAGQSISGAGIPSGATIISFNSNSVTISANATASSTATFKGTTYVGSAIIANVSSTTGLVVGQAISGSGVPTNTFISAIGTGTVTMTNPATQINTTAVTFTSPSAVTLTTKTSATALAANTSETLTIPTTQAITIGQSLVTIAGNATATGVQTLSVLAVDPMDVEPGDPGDPVALATKGPQLIAGTSSNPLYQGFFNTASSGNGTANAPAGFAFTRTFSQVLAVLLNTNSTNAIVTTQNYQGGFYPVGVSGNINAIA
jgi:hypothetical protein